MALVTKQYVDNGDATTLYNAKVYADSRDAIILEAAKNYANSLGGSGGVSQSYVDNGDNTTLYNAKVYAEGEDVTTLAKAKTYSDTGDIATLNAAKNYANSLVTSGGVSQSYVDNGDITTLNSAKNYANNKFSSLSGEAVFKSTYENTLKIQSQNRYGVSTSGHSEVEVHYLPAYSGGNYGAVQTAFKATSQIAGAPNDFHWSVLGIADYSGSGGNGQHVGVYGQGIRRTQNMGGYINNPQIWAACLEVLDLTGKPSSQTNDLIGLEVDCRANNLDDGNAPWGKRQGISVVLSRPNGIAANGEISNGIGIYGEGAGNSNTRSQMTVKRGIHIGISYSIAVLEMRESTPLPGAHAIWMKEGQDIALNYSGTVTASYENGAVTIKGAPIRTAQYTVNALPVGFAGMQAFANNGRKPGEILGYGTGVPVFHDGSGWKSMIDGYVVTA